MVMKFQISQYHSFTEFLSQIIEAFSGYLAPKEQM
jgi:hypothetical protein